MLLRVFHVACTARLQEFLQGQIQVVRSLVVPRLTQVGWLQGYLDMSGYLNSFQWLVVQDSSLVQYPWVLL